MSGIKKIDRDILALAVPALGSLIAEPIFLMADTAMVGHLGADALAALALAGVIMQTLLGLMIFLAYATTPRVARFLGAGDTRRAVSAGFDGMWLALLVSLILLVGGLTLLSPVLDLFHPAAEVRAPALEYLTISWWGLPFMLIVIAATGLLRGLQDTRTPLVIASLGFGVNIVLNAVFIYGMGMAVAGSALGTVLSHAAMCAIYVSIALRAARRHEASLLPDFSGVWEAAKTSGWLLIRNASLRAALITLIGMATIMGTTELAAVHIAQTLFNSLALVLDALAIAGQAMVGVSIGRGDRVMTALVNRRLIQWGTGFGIVVGIVLAVCSPAAGLLFTADGEVQSLVVTLSLILASSLPLAGYVFTLDGVLMGASDMRYLAFAQFSASAGFIALAFAGHALWGSASVLWACFCWGYMIFRGLGLGLRMRADAWIVRAEKVGYA